MNLIKPGKLEALAGSTSFRVRSIEILGIQVQFCVRCYEGAAAPP